MCEDSLTNLVKFSLVTEPYIRTSNLVVHDRVNPKPNQFFQLITEKDGIVAENQKLSEENAQTKMTVTTYESRLVALETDREDLLGELREIVAMYDDLQVRCRSIGDLIRYLNYCYCYS